MKVFISSDMEGTAGVADWSQCLPDAGGDYAYYRGLLQAEVNAAIEGALSAGADEFLVNDSHSKMINLRPDTLAGNARYLSGRHKPLYMMQGLDSSFDAIFFVSYHGSMSASAPLSHTYNPRAIAEVSLNGVVVGESGINALVALGHGVPIVLITGDDVTGEEAARVSPGVHRAVVKTAVSRFAADSLHPTQACELIRTQAAGGDPVVGRRHPAGDRTAGDPAGDVPKRGHRRHGDLDRRSGARARHHGHDDRRRPDRAVPAVHLRRGADPRHRGVAPRRTGFPNRLRRGLGSATAVVREAVSALTRGVLREPTA